jgi:lipoprotein-releasing system permease protein
LSIFLAQGIGIGLAGTLLGCAIGFAFCWVQQNFGLIKLQGEIYYLDTLPVQISLWHYGIVIGASLVLSFFATLIPSLVAVRIQPIRAIRFK